MSAFRSVLLKVLPVLFLHPFLTQTNAQITMSLIQPNEITLASAEIWNCIIINQNNLPSTVYLYGIVTEATRGTMIEARSADFTLNTGTTQFNTGNYDVLKPEQDIYHDEIFREYVFRTNSVPNGSYTICLRIYNQAGTQILASQCNSFTVEHLTPPSLMTPSSGETICDPFPFFIWTPFRPWSGNGTQAYRVGIYQILPNQTAIAAARNNPAWFISEGIQSPVFQFPLSGLSWTANTSYAWYVSVLEYGKEITRSEVGQFTWAPCNTDAPASEEPGKKVKNTRKPGLDYYALSGALEGELLTIRKNRLNVSLTNDGPEEEVYYQVLNGNGGVIKGSSLTLHSGFNYYDFDVTAWNIVAGNIYMFRLLDSRGKTTTVKFIQPK